MSAPAGKTQAEATSERGKLDQTGQTVFDIMVRKLNLANNPTQQWNLAHRMKLMGLPSKESVARAWAEGRAT